MRALTLVFLAVATAAAAEPTLVTIPGKGWHFLIDVPPVRTSEGQYDGERFRSLATSPSGITFSLHTESAEGGGNELCRDTYWEKGSKNPVIAEGTVEFFEAKHLLGVSHKSEGDYQGKHFTTANAHGYFVQGSDCIDLHVSIVGYTEEKRDIAEEIVKSSAIIPVE